MEAIINQEIKQVIPTAEADELLNMKPRTLTDEELMLDYAFYKAQEICEALLSSGLITVDEFNKISKKNRDTFSPLYLGILPQIP